MKLVTFKIAKIAKQKGYVCGTTQNYTETKNKNCENDHGDKLPIGTVWLNDRFYNSNSMTNSNSHFEEFEAPTNTQLIDWIFSIAKEKKVLDITLQSDWLKFWLDTLETEPKFNYFKLLLREWFLSNNFFVSVVPNHDGTFIGKISQWMAEPYDGWYNCIDLSFDTLKEAEIKILKESFKQ